MKILVVYFSRDGKTEKVAAAIAGELGCKAIDVAKGTPDAFGADLLVVGSGNYGGAPGDKVVEFLEGLPQRDGARAAVFATSGGPYPKCIPVMQGILEVKGHEVISDYDCRGQFLLINTGHQDRGDLENARTFAQSLNRYFQ